MSQKISQSEKILDVLLVASAIITPIIMLTVRHGANAGYFCFSALALCAGLGKRRASSPSSQDAERRPLIWLCLSMTLPILVVFLNQISLWDFNGHAVDAPSRFLLAAVVLWSLSRLPAASLCKLRHVQWGLCIGALASLWFVWHDLPLDSMLRPKTPFATAITYGDISLVLGACALATLGWKLTRSYLEVFLKIIAGLAGLYASILSQSRGGWLAIPVLLLAFVALASMRWQPKLLLALLSLLFIGGVYVGNKSVQERIHLVNTEYTAAIHAEGDESKVVPSSVGERLEMWRAAVWIFMRHPLVGVGSQHIHDAFQERMKMGLMSRYAAQYEHAHNDYLQAMASYGVFGLFARLAVYFAPLLCFFRATRSSSRDRRVAGLLGVFVVLTFMTFGLTEAMYAITMNASFYCFMVVIFAALLLRRENDPSKPMP